MIRFLILVILLLKFGAPAIAAEATPSAAQLKRGEYIFHVSGCKSCHTDSKNKGKLLAGGTPLKTPFGIFYGPNITPDKNHGIGNWLEADFLKALREGISPDGSHYFPVFPYTTFTKMTDQDIKDLRAYIFSLPAVSQANKPHDVGFPFNIRLLQIGWRMLFFDKGVYQPDNQQNAIWNRGGYLVQALGHCSECHTPRNMFGGLDASRYLAGTPDGPEGEPTPNITPDEKTGIGKWSIAEIADVINSGMLPDGDFVGGSMTDVSENLAKLTANDLKAIVIYLKSQLPIYHKISSKK